MKKHWTQKIVMALLIVILSSMLLAPADFAQTVKMKIYPQITTIEIVAGSSPSPKQIVITTETDDPALNFKWTLNGPGTLKGASDAPGIIYLPPEEFSTSAKQAIIAVEVANKQGKKASSSVTLTLTAKELPPLPEVQFQAIRVKDKDALVNPMYLLNPGATVRIEVDLETAGRNVKLDGAVIAGLINVQPDAIIYTAPATPGEIDMVTLKVVDATTNEIVVQQLLMINVNNTAQ